jgi:TonB-linked SusC/RagA family outer membrane protein
MVLAFFTYGQSQTVNGTVEDAESGEPLAGATVKEYLTTNVVFTNEDGLFTITTSSDSAQLEVSYLGYRTQLITPKRGSNQIRLKPSSEDLKEVVVTALNIKRESKALGYAVQTLESKEISEVKSPNFVDNLAGRVAGVTVSQGATGVGSSTRISIRGEASFTNNNPLFIVDGIPINNSSIINFSNESASGFQEIDFGNGGMDLNADDIASVSVLKGPAAAALYGTRAANGVILITTKTGKEHPGMLVNFSSTTFIERPFQLPQFQNSYGQGNSGQFEFVDGLGGGVNDNITYSWGPQLDQGLMIPQFNSPVMMPDGSFVRGGDVAVHGGRPITPTEFVSHPDNLKDFYRTGFTTINHASISNNFDEGNYRFSFTDLRSESPIPGVDFDRNTLTGALQFDVTDKLHVSTSINYFNSRSDNRPSGGYGSENINYSLVAWGPRSMDISALQDYWQPGLENVQQFSFNYTFFDNPYFILLANRNSLDRDRLFGNMMASYDVNDELKIILQSGMDYSNELRKYQRHYSTNRFKQGAYAEQSVLYRENNTQLLLQYNKRIGVFRLDATVGSNRMDQLAASTQIEAQSLAQPGIFNFTNAATPLLASQFEATKRINSVFGVMKWSFKDLLFVDVTARNDWSSALATPTSAENTSFFYPSIAGSYILSNALNLPRWMSFLKARLSWAQVGNDTDPYQTSRSFIAGVPYTGDPTFTTRNVLTNAGLLPERTNAIEVGGDLRVLNNRYRLDITYYNMVTNNQIIALPVPISTGYNQQVVNGGAVRSQGIEIMMEANWIRGSKFNWSSFFNFNRNVSTVESLPEGADKITLAYSRVYDNENQTVWFQVEEGGRIGDMYGTGYLKNENGEFVIDADGKYVVDNTLKKLGNYNPDFILGVINEFEYKKWRMNFLVDWRQGGILVSRTLSLAGVAGQLEETENRPEEGIVADGQVNIGTNEDPEWVQNTTAVSAEQYYRQYYDRNHEENNVYDATYVKLRQFSISYRFEPNRETGWLQKGRHLDVSFIGRNVWAWSNIPHFDPEQTAVQGNQFVSGVEDMSYPTSRSLGIRLAYQF